MGEQMNGIYLCYANNDFMIVRIRAVTTSWIWTPITVAELFHTWSREALLSALYSPGRWRVTATTAGDSGPRERARTQVHVTWGAYTPRPHRLGENNPLRQEGASDRTSWVRRSRSTDVGACWERSREGSAGGYAWGRRTRR